MDVTCHTIDVLSETASSINQLCVDARQYGNKKPHTDGLVWGYICQLYYFCSYLVKNHHYNTQLHCDVTFPHYRKPVVSQINPDNQQWVAQEWVDINTENKLMLYRFGSFGEIQNMPAETSLWQNWSDTFTCCHRAFAMECSSRESLRDDTVQCLQDQRSKDQALLSWSATALTWSMKQTCSHH